MSESPSNLRPAKSKWYAGGLRFDCTACGICCSGEPGYVWVDQAEIAAMASELKLTVEQFESRYIRRIGPDKSLKEYADGDCILLNRETRGCTVYAARPTQCRTWPFWDSTLETSADWQQTCRDCPGAGKGRLYTIDEIESARLRKSV